MTFVLPFRLITINNYFYSEEEAMLKLDLTIMPFKVFQYGGGLCRIEVVVVGYPCLGPHVCSGIISIKSCCYDVNPHRVSEWIHSVWTELQTALAFY